MSNTYKDSAKQKSREKQKEFIDRNLLSIRKPRDVKVICFPGAEIDGEEAIEIREIYDPLGIPRQNIVGLEADQERAERLRKADVGIRVQESLDLDFFKGTDTQFEIVSLDYTGQQTEDRLKAIETLVGRHLLARYSVLCTNFATKREGHNMKIQLTHKRTRYTIGSDGRMVDNQISDSRMQSLEAVVNGVASIDLSDVKNALTIELVRILKLGKRNLHDIDVLKNHPYAGQILEEVKNKLETVRQSDDYRNRKNLLCNAGIITPEEFDLRHTNPSLSSNIVQRNLLRGLSFYLGECISKEVGFQIPNESADSLAHLLESQENKPYFPKTIERYSYNSNKNTMMFMDLFYLDLMENQHSRASDIVSIDSTTSKIRWNPLHESPKRIFRELSKIEQDFVMADDTIIPERTYLGSSWQSPKRMEAITREGAIELLRSGCSPLEISECYRGFSKMQLAALKAHYVTMGKEPK